MSDSPKRCFFPGQLRLCTSDCVAFVESHLGTTCRILNAVEKLVPAPTRPTPPDPPKVKV